MDQLLSSLKTQSLLIIKNNQQIYSYGDITHKILVRSCRKSFMNCMIGILVKNKKLNTELTLADLDIDDVDGLTDIEKTATILDLLKSRSGIYHPAAYESDLMKKTKPIRGSHLPGTFYYYNNWDFNTLGYIYNKISGNDFYIDLCKLGQELGMENFSIHDCEYHFESVSKYPAYDFKMNPVDMSKLGLLFLGFGSYNGKQFLSEEWIKQSIKSYSSVQNNQNVNVWPTNFYGMLWWIESDGPDSSYGAFGAGGHFIYVIPSKNMVIVHRVDNDSDENNKVGVDDMRKIINLCIELF